MEEILTLVVEKYVKCNDFSRDNLVEDLKSFTDHIVETYRVHLATVGKGSVIIILDCPTLDSLEHLWNDYLAGHLDTVAERYLVTDVLKKKLNLETVCLKTTIEEENYLNCKKALMELPSTYSGELKQNIWEVKLYTGRCSSLALLFKKCIMYKWRMGRSAVIMIITIIIIIITTTLMIIIIILIAIYIVPKALYIIESSDMVKITKIQECVHF